MHIEIHQQMGPFPLVLLVVAALRARQSSQHAGAFISHRCFSLEIPFQNGPFVPS